MHFTLTLHTILGLIGVAITLIAYGLLQATKLSGTGKTYSLLNILGSLLISYSLCFDWNLSAFIMEIVWLLLSIYGLWRHCKKYAKKSPSVSS